VRFAAAALAALLAAPACGFADEEAVSPDPFFSYRLVKHKDKTRGIYGRPLVSVVLPGFDQWMEGQYRSAIAYTAYAAVGVGFVASALPMNDTSSDPGNVQDDRTRRYIWGNQAYMDVGFVSAFHGFRSAAETRKAEGRFGYLSHEETTGDLLIAPLRFDYLLRPSILIPLGILGGILAADASNQKSHYNYQGGDMLFGTAVSYNAGVGEEAFFRGYMMPVLYDWWGNGFWSNTATATVFAAAHISASNPVPWPQFLVGLYLGWTVQRNEWQLSQAVFLHAWWDIIVFASELAYSRGGQTAYLPLVRAEF
jgi:membrane protease YdiL (CAAX protease family)